MAKLREENIDLAARVY